jgi:hypothetical protein
MVVYVDALIPRDGQSGLDLLPKGFGDLVRGSADASGHGWVPMPQAVLPPEGLIPEEMRARYVARLRPQPVATFTESIHFTGVVDRLPHAFVRCTRSAFAPDDDPIAPFAAEARARGWLYRELATPHDPQLFAPEQTAAVLNGLAGRLTG